jgi:4'-phosphopantetheinyl transferase
VFFLRPERQTAAGIARAYDLLDAEERDRAESFGFARDRVTYVLAHALLRRELERYTGIAARALGFHRSATGRPDLALPPMTERQLTQLRFNLAHTRGLVGCAVALGVDVGFDLEEVREPAPLEVAHRYFSRPELVELNSIPRLQQARHFFTLWTLKEAYLKARGIGLSLDLDCFALAPSAQGSATLELLAGHPPEPRQWAFRWWHLQNQCAAVAVQMEATRLQTVVFEEELF